jgi:cytochrome c-type biogenesis protein CcmH/NrfG
MIRVAGRVTASGRAAARRRTRPVRRNTTMRHLWYLRPLLLAALGLALAPLPATAQRAVSTVDNPIAYYQSIIHRNPRDARALHRLGDAYIRKARESGDVAYFDRAERAIRRSLELAPDSAGAWRHLAYVRYSLHDFADAAHLARRAIDLDATDSHAHGVLGDALLEVGRYGEA